MQRGQHRFVNRGGVLPKAAALVVNEIKSIAGSPLLRNKFEYPPAVLNLALLNSIKLARDSPVASSSPETFEPSHAATIVECPRT
jgi:hypothetical protein